MESRKEEDERTYLKKHREINSDSEEENYPADLKFFREKILPRETVVYIWNPRGLGLKSIGHIAVAFNHNNTVDDESDENYYYASYWPEEPVKTLRATEIKKGKWHNKHEDSTAEKRAPDYTKKLYTLNVKKMVEAFKIIKEVAKNWHISASTPFKTKSPKEMNCVSVALLLLKVGGLEKLAKREIVKSKPRDYHKNKIDKCCKKTSTFICIAATSFLVLSLILGVALGFFLFVLTAGPGNDEIKQGTINFLINLPPGVLIALGGLIAFSLCIACCQGTREYFRNPHTFYSRPLYYEEIGAQYFENVKNFSFETSSNVQKNVALSYDTIRAQLIEQTVVPDDHRIKKVLEKAAKAEGDNRTIKEKKRKSYASTDLISDEEEGIMQLNLNKS